MLYGYIIHFGEKLRVFAALLYAFMKALVDLVMVSLETIRNARPLTMSM
jgi:hypothetical protein